MKRDDGFNLVVVKKAELIAVLKSNRDNHRQEFEKALDGWKILAIQTLEERLTDARKGVHKAVFINLPMPEDHTRDYDRRIRMYEMDVEDTVEMDEHEFAQYVEDDWGWKQGWTTSNATYMAASAAH